MQISIEKVAQIGVCAEAALRAPAALHVVDDQHHRAGAECTHFALEQGLSVIDVETLYEAKAHYSR